MPSRWRMSSTSQCWGIRQQKRRSLPVQSPPLFILDPTKIGHHRWIRLRFDWRESELWILLVSYSLRIVKVLLTTFTEEMILLSPQPLSLSKVDRPCDAILLYRELLLNMDKMLLLVLLSKILSILKVEHYIYQFLPTLCNLDTNSSSSTPCTRPSLKGSFSATYRSNRVTEAASLLSCNRYLGCRPLSQHRTLIGSELGPYQQTFVLDQEVWKDPSRIRFSATLSRILQQ